MTILKQVKYVGTEDNGKDFDDTFFFYSRPFTRLRIEQNNILIYNTIF